MPAIDYMKLLDIAALTLETSSHIEVNALDLKLFKAVLSREEGSDIEILVKIDEFEIELSFDNKIMSEKEFDKWLRKFEYHLEQHFFKNISIETSESKQDYRVKILY